MKGFTCPSIDRVPSGNIITGVPPRSSRSQVAIIAVTLSVLTDMLDGAIARARGTSSPWGAFLDSTMDRYSDMLLYMGLMILYARLDKRFASADDFLAALGGTGNGGPDGGIEDEIHPVKELMSGGLRRNGSLISWTG